MYSCQGQPYQIDTYHNGWEAYGGLSYPSFSTKWHEKLTSNSIITALILSGFCLPNHLHLPLGFRLKMKNINDRTYNKVWNIKGPRKAVPAASHV